MEVLADYNEVGQKTNILLCYDMGFPHCISSQTSNEHINILYFI